MRDRQARVARHWRRQRGECWYCGKTCWINTTSHNYTPTPHDMATLEHLFSRMRAPSPLVSGTPARLSSETVMACFECNQNKGIWSHLMTQRDARITREDMSERSNAS